MYSTVDMGAGFPATPSTAPRRTTCAFGTRIRVCTGTGLGLSIVQRIVDLHRGTIRLDSPASTIGLQVMIALPRVVGERA